MMRTLQLNWGLSSEFPDTVRLDPAGTASPFLGDTICTNALMYQKSPGLVKEKDSTRIITNKKLVVESILYENRENLLKFAVCLHIRSDKQMILRHD
jgi:hypothetical protein